MAWNSYIGAFGSSSGARISCSGACNSSSGQRLQSLEAPEALFSSRGLAFSPSGAITLPHFNHACRWGNHICFEFCVLYQFFWYINYFLLGGTQWYIWEIRLFGLFSFMSGGPPSIQQSVVRDPPGTNLTLSQCSAIWTAFSRNSKESYKCQTSPSSRSGDISGIASTDEKSDIPNLMPAVIWEPGIQE